ncbi:MAG TPA: hypothetical protein VJX67_26700 [Blastocatellia bacterium]|nr:hypothetical protein [Blastocatellia bacterium]
MTRDEARAYVDRYNLVNKVTAEESRRMSPAEKLRLTAIMYWAAKDLGWQEKLREGEEEVWERWQVLRERLGCPRTT